MGKFDTYFTCAGCGAEHTHQERVEVFARDSEDNAGLRMVVKQGCFGGDGGAKASIDTDLTSNPSDRRDGVSIFFNCEHCPAISRLDILQHKGTTYIAASVQEGELT